jgi:hypothetical protein
MPLHQRELTPDRVTGGERITDFPATLTKPIKRASLSTSTSKRPLTRTSNWLHIVRLNIGCNPVFVDYTVV